MSLHLGAATARSGGSSSLEDEEGSDKREIFHEMRHLGLILLLILQQEKREGGLSNVSSEL